MFRPIVPRWRFLTLCLSILALGMLSGCGGSTGNDRDSGPTKTYLSVQASDTDSQPLQYQWRVTGGTVENRNAPSTVWTLPDGPGLHFAYVVVSDGKGGYAEQQYAVSSDLLEVPAPARAPTNHTAPSVVEPVGAMLRLRFVSGVATLFTPPGGGAAALRYVYLPDVRVQVIKNSDLSLLFSGRTDLSGEVDLPRLQADQDYTVNCATNDAAPLTFCAPVKGAHTATVQQIVVAANGDPALNLRLFGHVAQVDGSPCGYQNSFFELQSAATVALQTPGGTALASPRRVNRFGDYAIDAAVPAKGPVQLKVQCEGYSATVDLAVPSGASGYVSTTPVEASHIVANSRPRILKMVAQGADGNVRGQMIVPETGASSNASPGGNHFLTYKGRDSKLGSCMYYRALGAVGGCDAQGNMINPISFDDWKRQHRFAPFGNVNGEVAATFINKMDLNLVRRMVATATAPDNIAFYVCNNPGPEGSSQREIDAVLSTALAELKRVACVAMEWSKSPGANGGQPLTKFFTFGPDGALLQSINLDGRGEKYMPGACVACHGGTVYNGRFPEKGNPSPYLGSGFLPFDTANYYFGSSSDLTETSQSAALKQLNQLVAATETSPTTAVSRLVSGWYADAGNTLNKQYVPSVWAAAEVQTPGASRFYREVIGSSCRTCHAALGPNFNWDGLVLTPARAMNHVCGGSADLAVNASMPNALITRDRVLARVAADPLLAALMTTFLGCSAPRPDPVYPHR